MTALRVFAYVLIFFVTATAWAILAGVNDARTRGSSAALYDDTVDLWGAPLTVSPPAVTVRWSVTETVPAEKEGEEPSTRVVTRNRTVQAGRHVVDASVDDDPRQKGLVWFPLYDVSFDGRWTYPMRPDEVGTVEIRWDLPAGDATWDGLRMTVDDRPVEARLEGNTLVYRMPAVPDTAPEIGVTFATRGQDTFRYAPRGTQTIDGLSMTLRTDFEDIDHPSGTLSPTDRSQEGEGWVLRWDFEQLVTSKGFGVTVPRPMQPGELATRLTASAPWSLALFTAWILALAVVRRIPVHPMHMTMLAASFFSFHLLFAYSVDTLGIPASLALCSVVSVGLVVSYTWRAISPRFAFAQAGAAQLVFLIGFSLANVWEGYTGLTITVTGIATLFALMHLTAHVDWDRVFSGRTDEPTAPQPA